MSDRTDFLKKLLMGSASGRVYRKAVWEWRDGKLVERTDLAQTYEYTGPVALASAGSPNNRQVHYRTRTDSGGIDASPTWGAAEDTAFWPGYNTNFRLRAVVENTGTAAGSIGSASFFRCGFATAVAISTTSAFIKAADASTSADAAAVTVQRLTSGTGVFQNGQYDEDGSLSAYSLTNGNFTELEYGLQLLSADLGGGETVTFQINSTVTRVVDATYTSPNVDGSDFQHGVQLGVLSQAVANSASISLTTINAVPSGNQLIVVSVACDNNGTTDSDFSEISGVTIGGVAATKAKEFTNGQGSAQAGATVSVWYLQVTGGLASSSSIVASFTTPTTNGDACVINARAFTVATGKTVSIEATNQNATDGAAVPSLDCTTSNIECLRVRATACETSGVNLAGSSGTSVKATDSNWSLVYAPGNIAGLAGPVMGLLTESRISTGTGAASQTRHAAAQTPDSASVYVAFKANATAITRTPPQGNLALSGTAPTVTRTDHATIAPTAGQLALSGTAPGLVVNSIRSPAAGDLVLSGTAPTAVQDIRRDPAQGNLALSGTAPTVSVASPSSSISPNSGNLVLSGTAPTVARTTDTYLYPARANLFLHAGGLPLFDESGDPLLDENGGIVYGDSAPPTVIQDNRRDPAQGNLVLSGTAPTVAVSSPNVNLSPSAAQLVLSPVAPTLVVDVRRDPTQGNIVLSSVAPSRVVDIRRDPLQGNVALSSDAPSRTVDVRRDPSAAQAVLSGTAPSLVQDIRRDPSAGDLALTPTAPSRAVDNPRFPAQGNVALSGTAPSVLQGIRRDPASGDVVLSGTAPSVVQTTNAALSPAAAQLTLSSEAVSLSAGGNLSTSPASAQLALSSAAPTVKQDIRRDPASGDVVLSSVAPSRVVDARRDPASANLVLSTFAPTVASLQVSVAPSAGQLQLTGTAPTVAVSDFVSIVIPAGNLIVTTDAPSLELTSGVVLSPDAGVLVVTGIAPSVVVDIRYLVPVESPPLGSHTGADAHSGFLDKHRAERGQRPSREVVASGGVDGFLDTRRRRAGSRPSSAARPSRATQGYLIRRRGSH